MVKEFSISFYVANVIADGNRVGLETSLRELVNEHHAVPQQSWDNIYVVKELETWNNGEDFRGIFGKIRMSDLPHLANRQGLEKRLPLAADEGLIEKNHFIFNARHQLLIFQENFHGSRVGTFARYLTQVNGRSVAFNPILNTDVLAQQIKRGTEVTYVEIETDEGAVPLDLLADRVKARVSVEMEDRYPISSRMFEAMEQARRQSQEALTAFFGADTAEME